MSYRSILKQAWKTTWKNKYLWFFGLFAVLLGNNGGLEAVFKLLLQEDSNLAIGFKRYIDTGVFSFTGISSLGKFIVEDPLSFIILVTVFLIFIVLGVFLIWLSVVSQAVLVKNTALDETGKEHSFKKGMEAGVQKFWPVFGLNFGFKVIIGLIVILVGFPTMLSVGRLGLTISNIIFVLLFVLFIPIVIALSFSLRYAVCFSVLKDQKIKEALRNSWVLLKNNWLISLEMSLALLGINLAVTIAILLIFLILAIPILFLAFMFAKFSFVFLFWLVITAAMLCSFLAVIFSGAILASLQTAAWTSLFIQISGKGGVSKLVRIFAKK